MGVLGDGGESADQLADMRHVYSRQAKEDTTQGHRTCRKWLRDDPRGFMAAKTKLEEAVVLAKAAAPVKGPGAEDKGTAACEEMYDRLLREWGEELR